MRRREKGETAGETPGVETAGEETNMYNSHGANISRYFRRMSILLLILASLGTILNSLAPSLSRWIAELLPSNPCRVPLIVLKVPRSGSTWFAEMLNDIPTVYLSKEIIQRHDVIKMGSPSTAYLQEFLTSALRAPIDKFSYQKTMFPSARYVEDYIYKQKFLISLDFIGFSVNPELVEGVDWHVILSRATRDSEKPGIAKVVILIRSNVVKMAFSGIRGEVKSLSTPIQSVLKSTVVFFSLI